MKNRIQHPILFLFIIISFYQPFKASAQEYPPARFLHAMAADDTHLYILGGFVATEGRPGTQGMDGEFELDNDFWTLAFESLEFSNKSDGTKPDKASSRNMEIINGSGITFGGREDQTNLNLRSTWAGNLSSGIWENLNPGGDVPLNLSNYADALLEGLWYLFAGGYAYESEGETYTGLSNYLYSYQASSNNWAYVAASNPPPACRGGKMVSLNGKLWFFGGNDGNGNYLNQLWSFDPDSNTWTNHTPANPGENWPGGRIYHLMEVQNGKIVVIGGQNRDSYQDQWTYDPGSNSWEKNDIYPEDIVITQAASATGPDGAIYSSGGLNKDYELQDEIFKVVGKNWWKLNKPGKVWQKLNGETEVKLTMTIEPSEAAENGCSVSPSAGEHQYDPGTVVNLTATDQPDQGWYFLNWTGGVSGDSKTTITTMDADKQITAHFKEVKLEVTGNIENALCPCELGEQNLEVCQIKMRAIGDDWLVNSFILNEDKDYYRVKNVYLASEDRLIWNGGFSPQLNFFQIGLAEPIRIPENESVTLTISYDFPDEFINSLKQNAAHYFPTCNPQGQPEHFDQGLVAGLGKGNVGIARIFNIEQNTGHSTIQDALDLAARKDNDHLQLCPEEFFHQSDGEQISVNLSKRPSFDNPVIWGEGTNPTFTLKNGTIENITFRSRGLNKTALLAQGSTNLEIRLTNFISTANGIKLKSCQGASIRLCDFSDCAIGIELQNSQSTVVNISSNNCISAAVSIEGGETNISGHHDRESEIGIYAKKPSILNASACHYKNSLVGILAVTNQSRLTINGNFIDECSNGIDIQNTINSTGVVCNNHLISNGTALRITGPGNKNIKILNNIIEDSKDWSTGIHLTESSPYIRGNQIVGNNGAGIQTNNGSDPEIQNNNIYGNYIGIENTAPDTQLKIGRNYWGSSDGPRNEDIAGSLEVNGWLSSELHVVSSFLSDSLLLPPNKPDSIEIFITDLSGIDDQVFLSWNDSQNWTTEENRFSLEIDSTGSSLFIPVQTPAVGSPSDNLAVSVQSSHNPERIFYDTITLMTYEPELTHIIIQPDSLMVKPGDTLNLTLISYDQYQNSYSGNWVWTSNQGEIIQNGTLICPEAAGEIEVKVSEGTSEHESSAHFYCTNEQSTTQLLVLSPIFPRLIPGMKSGFNIRAWNQFNYPTQCEPEWSCTLGNIYQGVFTAGYEYGTATITATDPQSGVSADCQIEIVATLGVQETEIHDDWLIFPNPGSGDIQVTLPNDLLRSELTLSVVNLSGKELFQMIIRQPDSRTVILPTAGLKPGMYFLLGRHIEGLYKTRFIKN